jgi:hypothetical protein
MGTNYYWHEKPTCVACHRPFKPRHIGKSSAGWVFALHVYPEDGITDMDDWERIWISGGEIRDEYGALITVEEMRLVVLARLRPERWDKEAPFMYESWEDFHLRNSSMIGPAGLLRTRLETRGRCVKHGVGTWDCFTGEFS